MFLHIKINNKYFVYKEVTKWKQNSFSIVFPSQQSKVLHHNR